MGGPLPRTHAQTEARSVKATRLEAFTDGVVAIIITITVLELPVPHHADQLHGAPKGELPILFAYVLSFVNVGIYWNNHHHLFQAARAYRRQRALDKHVHAVLDEPRPVDDPLAGRERICGTRHAAWRGMAWSS